MSDQPIHPEEVFHSALPIGASLVVVFVPSKDRDRQPIDQDHWVDAVLATLGLLFRGATAHPRGRGVWRDDERGRQGEVGVVIDGNYYGITDYLAE